MDRAEAAQESNTHATNPRGVEATGGGGGGGGGVFRDVGGTIDDMVINFEGIGLDEEAQYGTMIE